MHNFDVKKVKNEIVEWIRNWFEKMVKVVMLLLVFQEVSILLLLRHCA